MSSNVNCVEEQRMHGANAVRNTNREVERYYKRYSGIYHRSNSICYESSVCENRCYGGRNRPMHSKSKGAKKAAKEATEEATEEAAIQSTIETCQELGATKEVALNKVMEKLKLNRIEAEKKLAEYWK